VRFDFDSPAVVIDTGWRAADLRREMPASILPVNPAPTAVQNTKVGSGALGTLTVTSI
jgi:hypothetical protein